MEGEQSSKVEDLERRLQYGEKLKYVTNRIHSAKNISEILLEVQPDILTLFDADRITIYAVNPMNRELYSRFMVGTEVKEIRVPFSTGSVAGYVAATRKLVNIFDAYKPDMLSKIDPQLTFDRSWDLRTGYRTRQILAAPIVFNTSLQGVIQLINKKTGNFFTKQDEGALAEMSKILGIAFHNQARMMRTLADYLVMQGLVSETQMGEAMAAARSAKKDIEYILLSEHGVKKQDLGGAMSAFYGCKFLEYEPSVYIDRTLYNGLNIGYLRKAFWAPIVRDGPRLTVAVDNPRDPKVQEIKALVPAKEYEFVVSLREDILKFLDPELQDAERSARPASATDILAEMGAREDDAAPDAEEFAGDSAVDENAGAIVRLVNQILIDGYTKGASDIHIEPSKGLNKTFIRFRVDGACMHHLEVPYSHSRALVSRIKIMSNLDIAERRLPQDGKIKFIHQKRPVEFRVATLPTVNGEDVVLRILAAGEAMPMDGLSLSERNYRELEQIISRPYGIILCVGPTGSGKTTTLHAAIGYINKPERKIWTAEDPVEITQEGLRQVEVKPKIGFDFARAMRAFLRADPDVIMVGEMRDHETAAIGIEASLTGHLVLSTLHTNSAPETVTRLIDMDIDPFNFADALLGILAQRLARTLCANCKEAYRPDHSEFEELATAYGERFPELGIRYDKEIKLFRPNGCESCSGTGYRGRIGIHELLVGTDGVKALIQRKASIEEIRRQAIEDGMRTLYQDGIVKVFEGHTDIRMIRSVCIK